MKIVTDQISIDELKKMAEKMFGNLIKAVVDIEKEIMAVDGELHADEAELLTENGSRHGNLWGINIYPTAIPPYGSAKAEPAEPSTSEVETDDWIEFDSMVNLKPLVGNRTRGVDNPEIKEKILKIVSKIIKK